MTTGSTILHSRTVQAISAWVGLIALGVKLMPAWVMHIDWRDAMLMALLAVILLPAMMGVIDLARHLLGLTAWQNAARVKMPVLDHTDSDRIRSLEMQMEQLNDRLAQMSSVKQ